MHVKVAKQIWDVVKKHLGVIDDATAIERGAIFPGAGHLARESSYGDVQSVLGLSDLDEIEKMSNKGKLPASVVAYYLTSQAYAKTPLAIFFLLVLLGVSMGGIHPLVLKLSGKPPFGETIAAQAIYGYRVWVMGVAFFPALLFLTFPVLDSYKRYKLSTLLLASFGDGELMLARRKVAGSASNIQAHLDCDEDLTAYWVLCRLLGPNLYRNLAVRYCSAYLTVAIVFLVVGTAALHFETKVFNHELPAGVAVELAVFFVVGVTSILVTTGFCTFVNRRESKCKQVVVRAMLKHCPPDTKEKEAFVAHGNVVIQDLDNENSVLHPVLVAYQPASTATLSMIWSGSTAIAFVFFSTLSSSFGIDPSSGV